jgi:hypothetical protein
MLIKSRPQAVRDGRAAALTRCTVESTPVTDSHTARSQTVASRPTCWPPRLGAPVLGVRTPSAAASAAPPLATTNACRAPCSAAVRMEPPVRTDCWCAGITVAGHSGGTLEERWKRVGTSGHFGWRYKPPLKQTTAQPMLCKGWSPQGAVKLAGEVALRPPFRLGSVHPRPIVLGIGLDGGVAPGAG